MKSWISRKVETLARWADASALRFFHVRGLCCSDEFTQTVAARYDLERFGALQEPDHRSADVLVVSGAISAAAAEHLRVLHAEMSSPRWVMAVGSCACSGGLFSPSNGGKALAGISSVIPVDVFVAGCPPRPEAIIDGWILLQKKIQRQVTDKAVRQKRRLPDNLLLREDGGFHE